MKNKLQLPKILKKGFAILGLTIVMQGESLKAMAEPNRFIFSEKDQTISVVLQDGRTSREFMKMSTFEFGPSYPPTTRGKIITARLNSAYRSTVARGKYKTFGLSTEKRNNYQTICMVDNETGECKSLIVTLGKGKDANQALEDFQTAFSSANSQKIFIEGKLGRVFLRLYPVMSK
jgi:Circadian oscillating protein COP23